MSELLNALFYALLPLWKMSLTAAYVTAVVVILRLMLKKHAPKQVICLLWLVVFARLLVPVSLESPLSIVPDAPSVHLTENLPGQPEAEGMTEPVQPPVQILGPVQDLNSIQTNGAAQATVVFFLYVIYNEITAYPSSSIDRNWISEKGRPHAYSENERDTAGFYHMPKRLQRQPGRDCSG